MEINKAKLNFNIKLSRKDYIKGLRLPTLLSYDLAYILGVLTGDGNILVRQHKKDYRIKCVGNPKDEKEFYYTIIKPLFKKLFGIEIDLKKQDSGTTFGFYIYSRAMVEYLTTILGLPVGRKYDKLRIPKIIKENGMIAPFIRGLADTDFCITYKKKNYPSIVGSSRSKIFMKDVSAELKKMGFKFYEIYDYKIKDSRFKSGYSLISRVEINGRKNLSLWMERIGFLSPKHLSKIK